jgi:hypothetical protein
MLGLENQSIWVDIGKVQNREVSNFGFKIDSSDVDGIVQY